MYHRLENPSEKIPEKAREAFSILSGEIYVLRERWACFEFFYGHSQERVDILNKMAPPFFAMLNDLLFDYMCLAFSRLEEKTNGGQNMSLEFLPYAADINPSSEIGQRLEKTLESYRTTVAAIKAFRNKRIAHFDHKTAMQSGTSLKPVQRGKLKEALETAEKFLGDFDAHFSNSTTVFDAFSSDQAAHALYQALAKAVAYDALENSGDADDHFWHRFLSP